MERDPQTRKLGERYIRTADAVVLDETMEGSPMHTEHAFEEQIAERVERNGRWGRDASREEAIAELTNENAPGFALWEPRPPVRPRERQDSGVPVLDDF